MQPPTFYYKKYPWIDRQASVGNIVWQGMFWQRQKHVPGRTWQKWLWLQTDLQRNNPWCTANKPQKPWKKHNVVQSTVQQKYTNELCTFVYAARFGLGIFTDPPDAVTPLLAWEFWWRFYIYCPKVIFSLMSSTVLVQGRVQRWNPVRLSSFPGF